jgi:general secretion pathway protein J
MTRHNGFTLLEVLVALVVFGLLLAGLNEGVRYGLRAWESQVRLASGRGDLDAVDRALRRMIAMMDPGDGVDPAPFTATRDRLDFVTELPDAAGMLPVRRVAAALLIGSGQRLVLRWQPWQHAQRLRPVMPSTDTELLRDVLRLELAYWRPESGWVAAWRYADLPTLIRIRVIFPPGDPRHWPDIVARPELDRP